MAFSGKLRDFAQDLAPNEMNLSGRLKCFALDLAPSEYDVRRAGEIIGVVARSIFAHFKGRGVVDRIIPSGSYPKKTSISESMRVDVIVYINNQDPPFHDIINELYGIVRWTFDSSCKKNLYGVYFSHKALKIDLLPAKNFLPSYLSHDPDVNHLTIAQHARALNYVKDEVDESLRDFYSTSMYGVSVLFEQNRDSFSHCMSRLAKYWSSTLPIESMRGHASIMEYLGAYAAEEESKWNKQDIYHAFRRFLMLFESPVSIQIYWTEFYTRHDIPSYVMMQRPLLLDPCNPYNNLLTIEGAHNLDILRRMRPYAKTTLDRFEEAFHRGYECDIKSIIDPTMKRSVCSMSCVSRCFLLFVICCLCWSVFLILRDPR